MDYYWTLFIPGEAIAKGRGRIVRKGAHMGIVTPAKTRRYEDIIRQSAIRDWGGRPLLACAVELDLTFQRAIAPSWSKRKKEWALDGTLRPTSRPDLDNLIKAVTDGLLGIVYRDDAQIVGMTAWKVYNNEEGVSIGMRWRSEDLQGEVTTNGQKQDTQAPAP